MNKRIKRITEEIQRSERLIKKEKESLSKLQWIAAQKMRLIRCIKRITMRGAAKMLGISGSHYSDIENGHRRLTVELAIKADKIFGDKIFGE